jgi:hypothetical protein
MKPSDIDAEFDRAYEEYDSELRGLAMMHTGIRIDAGATREARRQAAKRLVFNVLKKLEAKNADRNRFCRLFVVGIGFLDREVEKCE